MTKRFCQFIALIILLSASFAQAFAQDVVVPSDRVTSFVHIRAQPTSTSASKGQLRPGESLPFVGKTMEGAMREHGKLIISLADTDLCGMLEMKQRGDDPSDYLFEMVDEFLMRLPR